METSTAGLGSSTVKHVRQPATQPSTNPAEQQPTRATVTPTDRLVIYALRCRPINGSRPEGATECIQRGIDALQYGLYHNPSGG